MASKRLKAILSKGEKLLIRIIAEEASWVAGTIDKQHAQIVGGNGIFTTKLTEFGCRNT